MANLISSFQQSKIRHAINAIATGFYKSQKTKKLLIEDSRQTVIPFTLDK